MSEATIIQELPPESPGESHETPASGRRLDPGFRRNLLIIGGGFSAVVLAMIALVTMRSGASAADKKMPNVSVSLPAGTTDVGTNGQLSPAMRQALEEKQRSEQAAAQRAGDPVFIPKDTLAAPQPIASAPAAGTINPPLAQAAAQSYQMSDDQRQRLENRRKGMERQLGALLASADVVAAQPQRVQFEPSRAPAGGLGSPSSPSGGASSGAPSSPVNRGPLVVGALDILPAELASPIDTYRTKYASARIVGGKLDGAFLTGSSTLVDEGLNTRYTMMRFNGKTYAVDAIALDEKTSTDALEANVDHRYLQRYVMPITLAFVGGYATAAAQPGSETVLTPGGAATTSPAPNMAQARSAGVAAAMQIAQQEVGKAAQKPLQAKLPATTPIGIMFNAPVHEGDAK